MLASSGLATPPCGVPRVFPLPPLMRRVPSASRSSIGALSHILIGQDVSIHDTPGYRLYQLGMRNRIEVLGQISINHVSIAPAYKCRCTSLTASIAPRA